MYSSPEEYYGLIALLRDATDAGEIAQNYAADTH
jgi:hypothetical protein